MAEAGEFFADRYELEKLLGRGGFSEVWLAKDKLTSIKVAIKIFAPGVGVDDIGISTFTKEFALVFEMNHSNILHPTHYDCYQRMPYLILPYCKNGSTFKYVGQTPGLSERECWKLIRDVAEGLAYLHEKRPPIIHQDIKPDNILISDENRYMITDFGISTRIRSTINRHQKKGKGAAGTYAYMGPERFSENPSPIMASDIWSLGATLYEIMTGDVPFGELGGLTQKNGADIPVINENYSQELKNILYRCVAPNTWDRPTARYLADYASRFTGEEILSGNSATDNNLANIKKEKKVPNQLKDNGTGKSGGRKLIFATIAFCAIIASVLFFALSPGESSDSFTEDDTIIYCDEKAWNYLEKGLQLQTEADSLMVNGITEDPKLDSLYMESYFSYKDAQNLDCVSESMMERVNISIDTLNNKIMSLSNILKTKANQLDSIKTNMGQLLGPQFLEETETAIGNYLKRADKLDKLTTTNVSF